MRALPDDRIRTLDLQSPLCVASGSSVRTVIETVQKQKAPAVIICEANRPIGIMTERDVLMKIVARDVNHDDPVDKFMTPDPRTLTPDRTIGEAIALMVTDDFRNVPIVNEDGEPIYLLRIADIIHHIAETFPEYVVNLPPRPHQQLKTPEGA
jgi:CBS domain-containing protein